LWDRVQARQSWSSRIRLPPRRCLPVILGAPRAAAGASGPRSRRDRRQIKAHVGKWRHHSRASPHQTQGHPALSWRLEVLGQYWANISVQSRRHVALPGRSLEFGRRFFRSFPPSLGGFDSLPRPSCDRAGDGSHDLGSWGCIARDHFNDPWRYGANAIGSPRGQLASSLTLRREGSHVALAQDVAFGRPPRPKLSGIDVVVYRLGGDAQYVCGFSNRHDLDTPLLSDEFASMPLAKSPEDGTDTVQCDA